jgi:hypothetical protein
MNERDCCRMVELAREQERQLVPGASTGDDRIEGDVDAPAGA